MDIYNMTKKDLAKKFNCTESEVLDISEEIITPERLLKTKVIKGFVNMDKLKLTSLGNVEVIVGESFGISDDAGRICAHGLVVSSKAKDLGNLKVVYGNVSAANSDGINFYGIKDIYGNLYLNHTNTKSLGEIKNIYGVLSVDHTIIKSLGENIKHIDKIIATTDLKLESFGSLETINEAVFYNTEDADFGDISKESYYDGFNPTVKLYNRFMSQFSDKKINGSYHRKDQFLHRTPTIF